MSETATSTGATAKAPRYYKSSLAFLILSLLSGAINYAYYPIIARLLTPTDFGAVQALIAILLQVGAVFAGLHLATIYLVNTLSVAESTRAVEILQKLTTGVFITATLAVTIFQTAVLQFLNIDNRLYISVLAFDLITTIPFIIAFGYLQARRQFVTAGALQLSVVSVKLIAGAFLARRFGASGALAGIGLGQVLGMLLFWSVGSFYKLRLWDHKALGGLSLPSVAEVKFIKPLAKAAGAIFLVNVTLIIYISFGIIAARHYFEPHTSGLFTGASTLASAITFACLPLIGVLLPHLNIKSLAGNRAELVKTSAMVLVVVGASIVVLAAASTQLLQAFGKDYTAMSYLMVRLGVMMSLVAGISLTAQVGAFYAPVRTALICLAGLSALVAAVMKDHDTLTSFVSTMTGVFATIALVGILQIIWIYKRGDRQ